MGLPKLAEHQNFFHFLGQLISCNICIYFKGSYPLNYHRRDMKLGKINKGKTTYNKNKINKQKLFSKPFYSSKCRKSQNSIGKHLRFIKDRIFMKSHTPFSLYFSFNFNKMQRLLHGVLASFYNLSYNMISSVHS